MPGTYSEQLQPTMTTTGQWPRAADDPDARALAAVAHRAPDDPVRRRVRDQVVCANLPMARRLAGCFAGRGESLEDLVQVANLALVRAANRFDASHGVSFAGFAGPTILGELRHHFRDTRWHLRVDRRLQELYLEVRRATDELTQELGRHPGIPEVAERVGAGVQDCERALAAAAAFQPLSLNVPVTSDEANRELSDLIGGPDPDLERVTDLCALSQAVGELTDNDRRLLALRFFGNLTQSEIAGQLGVSQMQVSRLLSAALAKLRETLLTE